MTTPPARPTFACVTAITDDPLRAWLRLWNGRLELLKETIHPEFVNIVPGQDDFDRAGLFTIINAVRTRFDVFSVKPELGPITQGDLTAGRWTALAVMAGDASAWTGHSILQVKDGRIYRHWEISRQEQGTSFALPRTKLVSGDPPAPRRRK